MNTLDRLIDLSLSRRQRNIFGDLGPRCPSCSGLGMTLRLLGPSNNGGVIGSPSGCKCHGSGLDIEKIERADRESLWREIHAIQSKLGLQLTSRYQMGDIKMSRQFWMETIAWSTLDGTAIANSTTEAIIMPDVTIPANYAADGRRLEVTLHGRLSTTSTPTIRFRARWGGVGGTVIWDSGTITNASGVTAALWKISDLIIQIRSNGATGTVFPFGTVFVGGAAAPSVGSATGAPAVGVFGSAGDDTPAAVTVDLSTDKALSVTAQWSAASSSNTLTGHDYGLISAN